MTIWTPDRVARLRLLWCGSMTAKQIAHELGTTRGAVIGKASRLGLVKGRAVRPPSTSVRQAVVKLRRKGYTVSPGHKLQRHCVDGIEHTTRELFKLAGSERKYVPPWPVPKDGNPAPPSDPAPKPMPQSPGFELGDHVQLSALGLKRGICRGPRCGTIVGFGQPPDQLVRVCLDGTKTGATYSKNFWEHKSPAYDDPPTSKRQQQTHSQGRAPPEPGTVCVFHECRGPPQPGHLYCAAHLRRPPRQRENMRLVGRG